MVVRDDAQFLHFVEHGPAPDPGVAVARVGNPVNRVISGCVLDNEVRGLLDRSPLTITVLDRWYQEGAPRAAGHLYRGARTGLTSPFRVAPRAVGLAPPDRPSDLVGMTSTASSAAWLPAALARAAVIPPAVPAVRPVRHAAAEAPGRAEIVSADRLRPDRHSEPAWSRELFEPARDEDPFEWLGFSG